MDGVIEEEDTREKNTKEKGQLEALRRREAVNYMEGSGG
jgi:hypothetical protein